jgi:hypothetical protein
MAWDGRACCSNQTMGMKSMNRIHLYRFLCVVTFSFLLVLPAGCSKKEEQQVEEKGSIEKMTDQAAETAVKKIRTPMDKARATENLGADRLEEMDKALQKQ